MDLERAKQDTGSQSSGEGPVMCKNICGCFGSAATMGLCSKCYTEAVLQQQAGTSRNSIREDEKEQETVDASSAQTLQPGKILAQPMECSGIQGEEAQLSATKSAVISRPASSRPPTANRCGSCRKRVGLTGFKCRCANIYCALHRYSDKHDCSYDYKAAGQKAIAEANPLVIAEKIVKI